MQQFNSTHPLDTASFFIGGINVHTFTSRDLRAYCESARHPVCPINVVYLVHYRGGDSSYCQQLAREIDAAVGDRDRVPVLYVTFDCRNHGERTANADRNRGWKSGNATHALDMALAIDGNVQDLRLIMDWLPSCLDLDRHLPAADPAPAISWRNVVCGVSLGGHTTFRFCSAYPESVRAACPIVGCSDLLSLLVNRLIGQQDHDYKKYFYHTYDELPLSPQQRLLYPKQVHDRLAKQDAAIFEQFPPLLSMFIAFGQNDTLVPPHFTKAWADTLAASNNSTTVHVEPEIGHDFNPAMLAAMSAWLSQEFQSWGA